MTPSPPTKTVGCLGALAIPFGTIAVSARLLVGPVSAQLPMSGAARSASPQEVAARPLTPCATRFVAAMLLCCTLLPALAIAARGGFVYRHSVAGLVGTGVLAWVAMFVGHLAGVGLFARLEPRLPHVDEQGRDGR